MKLIYGYLKKPFFGKYQVKWNWPDDVARDEWTTLTLDSGSGGQLSAIYAEAIGTARGAIVLAHPMGRAAKGHWLKNGLADALRARGFHVLAFDFNGFGNSGQGNFHYPLDVIAAGAAMRAMYPDMPLGVHGASFGAAWALCACARKEHPFDWAVLENPFTTLGEFWVRFRLANLVLKMISAVRPSLERALNPEIQAGRVHSLKTMQLHFGADDRVTPPEMGNRLVSRTKKGGLVESDLKLWPEAGHNGVYGRWSNEYLDSWVTGVGT